MISNINQFNTIPILIKVKLRINIIICQIRNHFKKAMDYKRKLLFIVQMKKTAKKLNNNY